MGILKVKQKPKTLLAHLVCAIIIMNIAIKPKPSAFMR